MNSSAKTELIEVHIITGFLGVGKTSCIQHLIKHKPENERWAILVNEYGKQGIDGSLFRSDEIIVKQIAGGCACCAALLPFQTALNQLIRHDKPDRILIEPSGLGHVDNIVKLLQDESYQIRLHLNGVVCVIDSRHLSLSKYRFHELYLRQIYAADLFVANKSELLTEHELKQFDQFCSELKISGINIHQAQLQLEDIKKPIVDKTKPFHLMQAGLKFYTHVFQLGAMQYDAQGLLKDLVKLKLTRIKGLISSNKQMLSINISEHEAKLEQLNPQSEQTLQDSVIECIDIAPINETTINKIVQENRMNG